MAIGVPGELRAYKKAYEEFGGGVPWSALFEPTIRLCEEGYIITSTQDAAIRSSANFIRNDPTLRYDLGGTSFEQKDYFSLFLSLEHFL